MEKTKPFGEKFMEVLNSAVSREEVVELSKQLVDTVRKAADLLSQRTEEHKAALDEQLAAALTQLETTAQSLSESVKETQDISRSEARTIKRYTDFEVKRAIELIEEVRGLIPDLTPLQTDYTTRIEEVSRRIPVLPEQRDYSTEIQATKEELLAKIEELEKELRNRPIVRGGGTSAMGVAQTFKYIAHTEALIGDVDGVNTTYQVKNNIWWIAGITINGEVVAELPNFTFSGKTITFATAIPAAYATKDIEVKYIGV